MKHYISKISLLGNEFEMPSVQSLAILPVQQFATEKEEKKAVDQVTGLFPMNGKFE
jgi:hypothetical protein